MITAQIQEIKNIVFYHIKDLENKRLILLRKVEHNRYFFAFVLFIGLLLFFLKIHVQSKKIEIEIILDGVMTSIVVVLFFNIKPLEYLSTKQRASLKNNYKFKIIKTIIQNNNSEFQYHSIYKTHKSTLIESGLFGGKIDEHIENDIIIGEIDGIKFNLSQLYIGKGLVSIFHGLFVNISGSILYNSSLGIQNLIIESIIDFNYTSGNEVKISIKGKRIYIAITNKSELFDFNIQKSLFDSELLEKDIKILFETFELIRQLTRIPQKILQ